MPRRRGRAWRERPLGRTGMTTCMPWLGANCTREVVWSQGGSRTPQLSVVGVARSGRDTAVRSCRALLLAAEWWVVACHTSYIRQEMAAIHTECTETPAQISADQHRAAQQLESCRVGCLSERTALLLAGACWRVRLHSSHTYRHARQRRAAGYAS
jgi:hypothetical protein